MICGALFSTFCVQYVLKCSMLNQTAMSSTTFGIQLNYSSCWIVYDSFHILTYLSNLLIHFSLNFEIQMVTRNLLAAGASLQTPLCMRAYNAPKIPFCRLTPGAFSAEQPNLFIYTGYSITNTPNFGLTGKSLNLKQPCMSDTLAWQFGGVGDAPSCLRIDAADDVGNQFLSQFPT